MTRPASWMNSRSQHMAVSWIRSSVGGWGPGVSAVGARPPHAHGRWSPGVGLRAGVAPGPLGLLRSRPFLPRAPGAHGRQSCGRP